MKDAQAVLDIDGVSKHFGPQVALDRLTLRVPEGTIFGLLGPNGAGKTTLLRMVFGLVEPDVGSIRVFGNLRPGAREARRQLGYMPQKLALYPGLSVRENIRFFGRVYGLAEAELPGRIEDALGMVDLVARGDSLVGTLSGGMARRAMLASAVIHRPRLLVLDEPTAGVDPVLRLRFWDWFAALKQQGTSVIITTHHISEADRCDLVAFLRAGKVLELAPPRALIDRHRASNLEEAFVRATGDGAKEIS